MNPTPIPTSAPAPAPAPTPPVGTSAQFNNGAPLTSTQVQQMRTQAKITPSNSPGKTATLSPTDRLSALKSNSYTNLGKTTATPASDTSPSSENTIVGGAKDAGQTLLDTYKQQISGEPGGMAGDVVQGAQRMSDSNTVLGKVGAGAETGLNVAGDAVTTLFAPITAALKGLADTVSDPNNKTVQNIATNPILGGIGLNKVLDIVDKVSSAMSGFTSSHPRLAQDTASAVNVILGALSSNSLNTDLGDVFNSAKDSATRLTNKVGSAQGTPEDVNLPQEAVNSFKTNAVDQLTQNGQREFLKNNVVSPQFQGNEELAKPFNDYIDNLGKQELQNIFNESGGKAMPGSKLEMANTLNNLDLSGVKTANQLQTTIENSLGKNSFAVDTTKPTSIPGNDMGTKLSQNVTPDVKDHFDSMVNMIKSETPENIIPAESTKSPTVMGVAKNAFNSVKSAVGSVEGKIGDITAPVREKIGDLTTPLKNKISDMATPLDQRVQTLIENATPEKAPKLIQILKGYIDQAKTATKTNSATPYETAGETQIKNALTALKSSDPKSPGLLDKAGQTMNAELDKNGANPVDFSKAETQLNAMMQDRLGSIHETNIQPSKFGSAQESMDYIKNLEVNSKGLGVSDEPVSGKIYNAPGRTSRIQTSSDRSLIDSAYNTLDNLKSGGNTLKQVQDEVSNLQNKIAESEGSGAKPIKTPTQAVVAQFAKSLNDASKEVGGTAYTDAKATYSQLKPLYDDLSKAAGDNYKNAASLAKQAFSPVSKTRALFEKVQNATGVPIFDHLNLAKFAMEVAHDPRVESLLEQGQGIAKDIGSLKINEPATWLNFIKARLNDPEGKAIRMLQNKAAK